MERLFGVLFLCLLLVPGGAWGSVESGPSVYVHPNPVEVRGPAAVVGTAPAGSAVYIWVFDSVGTGAGGRCRSDKAVADGQGNFRWGVEPGVTARAGSYTVLVDSTGADGVFGSGLKVDDYWCLDDQTFSSLASKGGDDLRRTLESLVSGSDDTLQVLTLQVGAPVPTRVEVTPPPEARGTLDVSTTPARGDIYVDGQWAGQGSLRASYAAGVRNVSFGRVEGFLSPAPVLVAVNPGQVTYLVGRYQEGATPTPTKIVSTPRPWRVNPSVALSSTKTRVKVGEDALLTLSMVNPSANDVGLEVDAILKVPSGVNVESTSFVSGGSNQVLGKFALQPGKENHVAIRIQANEAGEKLVESQMIYFPIGNKDSFEQLQQTHTLRFEAPGASPTATPAPSPVPKPTPGFEAAAGLGVLLAIAFLLRLRAKH